MPSNRKNNKQCNSDKLASKCAKEKLVLFLTKDNKIGVFKFSFSKWTQRIFNNVGNIEFFIEVSRRQPSTGIPNQSRNRVIGEIPLFECPKMVCKDTFEQTMSLEIYKILNGLHDENAELEHLRSKGMCEEISKKDETWTNFLAQLNKNYKYKYKINSRSVGGDSKLYALFCDLCEYPLFDLFVDEILKYLISDYHRTFFVNAHDFFETTRINRLRGIQFNDAENNIEDKNGFIRELLKSIDIELVEYIDSSNISSHFKDIEIEILYSNAKHNSELLTLSDLFKENLRFPKEQVLKKINAKP